MGEPTAILSGTFDNVSYKKRGQTFTLIAYRKANRQKFGQFWRLYKKEHPFVTAEHRLHINRDGTIHGRPRFGFLQANKPFMGLSSREKLGSGPMKKF